MKYLFNLAIAIAAVMAVFMIVLGGFTYMTTDSWQKKTDGRQTVTNAVLGLLLALGSFLILRTINPKLVEIDLNGVTPLKVQPSPWSQYYNSMLPYMTAMVKEKREENTTLNNDIIENEQTIAALKKEKNDLLLYGDGTGLNEYDPRVQALDQAIAQKIGDIENMKNQINLNTFNGSSEFEMQTVRNNPDEDLRDLIGSAKSIQRVYNKTSSATDDPATAVTLGTQKDKDMLEIVQKYSNIIIADPSVIPSDATLVTTLNPYLPSNPDLRKQALQSILKAQRAISNASQ